MSILFQKEYDGESLHDAYRDVSEAFEEAFNPALANVPKDEFGFQKGTFVVKVEWKPEGGIQ
jgi:hypothetical protein